MERTEQRIVETKLVVDDAVETIVLVEELDIDSLAAKDRSCGEEGRPWCSTDRPAGLGGPCLPGGGGAHRLPAYPRST
jgi:hypothetical protein